MASISSGASSSFYIEQTENVFGDFGNVFSAVFLKPLDDVLRCGICFEYFNSCMMTKCNHNYCSLCIRRYMSYKSQCPTCFQVATEPELRNNRLVDEILRIYKKIRETLDVSSDSQECNSYATEKATSHVQSLSEEFDQGCKISEALEQPTYDCSKMYGECEHSEVSCPVCYSLVLRENINTHLNTCLKHMEKKNSKSERKSLPKLVYHLLSDEEIKKKLKEHDLPLTGDRQTFIRRHKNFINLYNANCDSLNPRPVSELLKEIELQENEEKRNAIPRKVPINKRSDPLNIEKEQVSYARHHQTQFNTLMNDIIERQKNFTSTVCSSIKNKPENASEQKTVVLENSSKKDNEKEVSTDASK